MKKRRLQKLTALVLSIIIAGSQLPIAALAASPIAHVGNTPYYDIGTAWLAAQSGSTLVLAQSWNTRSYGRLLVPSGKSVTIDLKGCKIDRGLYTNESDYSNIGEVFYMAQNSTLTLKNGTVCNGYTSNYGGGIYMAYGCTVNLDSVVLSDNATTTTSSSGGYGGGIYVGGDNATINMKNSHIDNNYAYQNGGGVFINGENCRIKMDEKSTIASNKAEGYGGGIYVGDNKANIEGGKISDNTAGYSGGGIYDNNSYMEVTDTTITRNSVGKGYYGAGVYMNAKYSTLSGCTIESNKGAYYGGGVYINANRNTISGCVIKDNESLIAGGGVFTGYGNQLKLNGTITITGNRNAMTGLPNNLFLERTGVGYAYIGSPPAPNSQIGLNSSFPGEQLISYSPDTYNERCFTSDRSGYYVTWSMEDRNLYMKQGTAPSIPVTTITDPKTVPTGFNIDVDGKAYPVIKGYATGNSNSVPGTSIDMAYYYSDGYFAKAPAVYNEHLATMSLNMAMAAFNAAQGGKDYTNKFTNVKQLMADIGCDSNLIYVNDAFTKQPTDSSIGVAIGQKQLLDPSKPEVKTGEFLIPIAVRGGGYEAEWASNATFGKGAGEAAGFSSAATQVTAAVQQYIANYGLASAVKAGKVKFWIVGFSRGGATANLAAKRLVDAYGAGAVYCYTFEAPQGGVNLEDSGSVEKYTGIHNIINTADPVPMVGPKEMGFKRYGVDHYVPGDAAGRVKSTNHTTPNGRLVTTSWDNNPLSVKQTAYSTKRAEMLKQLGLVSSTFVFDDYFRLATVNYLGYGVGTHDLLGEKGSGEVTAAEYLPLLIEKLQAWVLSAAGTDYRYFYSTESIKNNITGKTTQSLETTLQHAMNLIFGKSAEDVKGITNSLGGVIDKLEITGIYFNVIGKWDTLTQSNKAYYLQHIWDALMSTNGAAPSMGDYLTAQEKAMLYEDWPVLGDILFRFISEDYKASGTSIDPRFNTGDGQILLGTLGYNLPRLTLPHNQEVVLAWLRSYDSYYDAETTGYKVTVTQAPAAPEANLASGSYKGDQAVSFKSAPGSSVYYSVDGGKTYQLYQNKPVQLKGPTTLDPVSHSIKAYTQAYGVKSDVISFDYTLNTNLYKLTAGSGDEPELYTTWHVAGIPVALDATPPEESGLAFVRWEVTAGPEALLTGQATKPTIEFKMPDEDVTLFADTVKKIKRIALTIDSPQIGHPLPAEVTGIAFDGTSDDQRKTPGIVWSELKDGKPAVVSGNAGYNTVYQATVTLTKADTTIFDASVAATVNDASDTKIDFSPTDGSVKITYTFAPTAKAKLTGDPADPPYVHVYTGVAVDELPLPRTLPVKTEDGTKFAEVTWQSGTYQSDTEADHNFTGTLDLDALGLDKDRYSDTVETLVAVHAKEVAAAPTVTSKNPTTSEEDQTITLATTTEDAVIKYTLSTEDAPGIEQPYDNANGIVLAAPDAGKTAVYTISAWTKSPKPDTTIDSSRVEFTYTITTPLPKYTVTIEYADTGLNPDGVGGTHEPTTQQYTEGTPFSLVAPELPNEVFAYWELVIRNDADSTDRTLTFEGGITTDITLRAVYNPLVTNIKLEIVPPAAGEDLTLAVTKCTVKITKDYSIDALLDEIVWITLDETAGYNTSYTAALMLKESVDWPDDVPKNLKFYFADNMTLDTGVGTTSSYYQGENGVSVNVKFPATAKAKLLGVVPPSSISIAHGEDVDLPKTVEIFTEDGSVTSAAVSWSGADYDHSKLTAQRFIATGTITLPNTLDSNGVSLTVTQEISISGAASVLAPVATLSSGEYAIGQTVILATLTEDADIYYTTDGTAPTAASAKYESPIVIDRALTLTAIAVKADMQDSSAAVFTYTIPTPGGNQGGGGSTGKTASGTISSGAGSANISLQLTGTVATLSISDAQLQKIAPATGTVGTVQIDVSDSAANALVIPSKLIEALRLSSGFDAVQIAFKDGSVTLDKTALGALTGGDVKIALTVQNGSTLTDAEKKPLGILAESAVVVNASAFVGKTAVTSFGNGSVSVTVRYPAAPDTKEESVAVWHIGADGTLTPVPSTYANKQATFTTNHFSTFGIVTFPFADVKTSDWFYSSVAYAYAQGLFGGTGDTTFSPKVAMTRGMLVTVLWRAEGQPKAAVSAFGDVAPGTYYADAVAWAAANNIVNGYDGKFTPDAAVTREQMAAILHRYAQYKGYDVRIGEDTNILSYADASSISQYAIPAMQWACGAGLLRGSDGKLNPIATASRAEVATLLERFMTQPWQKEK